VPAFLADLFDRTGHGKTAPCVGDEDIDRPEGLFDPATHRLDLGVLSRVGNDMHRLSASAFDVRLYSGQGRRIPSMHHDLCAVLSKQPSDHCANATRATSH
jgi:hypothetical protein